VNGSAASKKQPVLEQRSLANILLSTGSFSGFVLMIPPGAREHLAGPVASPYRHSRRGLIVYSVSRSTRLNGCHNKDPVSLPM
jgi:hypothetical protein